jgi:hypothetical protein
MNKFCFKIAHDGAHNESLMYDRFSNHHNVLGSNGGNASLHMGNREYSVKSMTMLSHNINKSGGANFVGIIESMNPGMSSFSSASSSSTSES